MGCAFLRIDFRVRIAVSSDPDRCCNQNCLGVARMLLCKTRKIHCWADEEMSSNSISMNDGRRTPWLRLCTIGLLGLLWVGSLLFSVVYSVPLTPHGRLGDGSYHGYDAVRSVGLAYGSIVVQRRRRTQHVGWELAREEFIFRVWPFTHGWWPIRTYGFPIPLLMVGVSITLIPYFRRTCRLRRTSGMAQQGAPASVLSVACGVRK